VQNGYYTIYTAAENSELWSKIVMTAVATNGH